MSPFLKHAEEIFGTASEGGREDCDWAILVGRDGGVEMLSGAGWTAESLRIERGASAVYRLTRRSGSVRLEGRSAQESCVIEARRPRERSASGHRAMEALLLDCPRYLRIQ